ncbi:MAG: tetratricopeptide repeat protein [Phycisphaerae bacterium]|nr:tetratricopeptide repeat protein [Phycisphaerae bacterium]
MFRHRMILILSVTTIGLSTARARTPRQVSMQQLSMPESMIYFLLRERTAGSTDQRADRERHLRLLRAHAHDKRRQVNGRWLTTRDFENHRKNFNALLREAQKHFRQATSKKKEPTHRERLAQSRHRAAGQTKLKQAADAWDDPLLRTFLLGAAALQAKDEGRAEGLFAQCIRDEPRVAAFYQGRARALMGLKRYSEAIRLFMQVLEMRPDSRYAVNMLQQALRDAPGANIDTPAFRDAKQMLEARPKTNAKPSRRAETMTYWLLPGKELRTGADELPTPPMDRLLVRQAIATPVAEHVLMVDSRILKDADEVLVRIDPKTFAPVKVRKSSRRNKDDDTSMALLPVPEYTFTPRSILIGDPKPDDAPTVHTVNTHAEMGSTPRRQPVRIGTNETGYTTEPAPALANGESAGIILTDGGKLAGVVVRDLDVTKDDPGETVFVSHDLENLLKGIKKLSRPSRRQQQTITPKDAPGDVFLVHAVRGERLSEE